MRGTAVVVGTLMAGGAAHDKQREHVDQAVSERHVRRTSDQTADVLDFEAPSRRLQFTAVLLLVTIVQVAWVSALGYAVFFLVQ